MKSSTRVRQRGATLLVGLVMLVFMTLIAATSFNLGKSNLQLVGNEQHRIEASTSAKAALEEVLSRAYFSETPSTPFGTTNIKTFDVNGDGAADVTVTVGDSANTTTNPGITLARLRVRRSAVS